MIIDNIIVYFKLFQKIYRKITLILTIYQQLNIINYLKIENYFNLKFMETQIKQFKFIIEFFLHLI